MVSKKRIDYRKGLEDLLKGIQVFGMKIESNGLQLLTKLLNSLNDNLILNIENDYKSAGRVTDNTLLHCGKRAIEKVFSESLRKPAMAEALRQLALLESGCMTYGDGSVPIIQQRILSESDTREAALLKRTQKLIGYFRNGVGKFCSTNLSDFFVDSGGKSLLGLRLHGFTKIVAEKAAEKYGTKDELQATDVTHIIGKYLGKDAMGAAKSEGNKYLLLFENNLIDFKPKRKIETDWSIDDFTRENIVTEVFIPNIQKVLAYRAPDAVTDKKTPKYLGQVLMDIARYLAQATSEICRKKKDYDMGHEQIFRAVDATFPEQLRQHALLKGSTDVNEFHNGNLIYEREIEEPKKPTKKPKKPRTKQTKGSRARQTKTSRSKQTKRPKSKGGRKSRSRTPAPKRKKTEKLAPLKLNFAPAFIDIIPEIFPNIDVTIASNASRQMRKTLNDIFDSIASVSLRKATSSGEFGLAAVADAIQELAPSSIADHGLSYGLSVVRAWEMENSNTSTDTTE